LRVPACWICFVLVKRAQIERRALRGAASLRTLT